MTKTVSPADQHQFCSMEKVKENLTPYKADDFRKSDKQDLKSDEKEKDVGKQYSGWPALPDLLLEKIFSYLSAQEKYYASLVCKSWNRAFYFPYLWSQFVLEGTTSRSRFNYSGWQYVLDRKRTQKCLENIGKYLCHLTFEPMINVYNLYEFMNMVSWYIKQARQSDQPDRGIGCNIKSLKFTFLCKMASRYETNRFRSFGKGGKLLDALKHLIANLKNIKKLELIDLMLDFEEAQDLLCEVAKICFRTLPTLVLINTTRARFQFLHVGIFLKLQVLVISPQNLGNDTVKLIGRTKLRHLHILQNQYTPCDIPSPSGESWKICRKNNPRLIVHLLVESINEKLIIWQDCAPVKTVLYDSPHIGVQADSLLTAIEMYGKELKVYGHKNIPRFYSSKSFPERIDGSLLQLCQQCPHLKVLVVTERISTSTVLLIAYTAKCLQYLYVRKNAVIKKCDWPQSPDWSEEFWEWLKFNSKSYDLVEKEVSRIMGCKWNMLSDKQFKSLKINLQKEL